jgi:tubulin---tyrosine ligase
MHILVTNDDGPPSYQSSPYVQSLVLELQASGHQCSVILPDGQRSWIGKAHMVGQTLTPKYYRPGTLLKDDGTLSDQPFNDGQDEWVLVDGTPASCTQLGLHHVFRDRGPIDLVVSGPNYGRNTTALFALSSGTLGAALEGAVNGYRSIALSFAFDSRDHDIDIITEAAKLSVRLVEKFAREWAEDVHVYSINVPVRKGVSNNKILYTEMIQNKWSSGSSYREVPIGESDAAANAEERTIRENENTNGDSNATAKNSPKHRTFKWAPHFQDVKISVENAGSGDGYEVSQGNVRCVSSTELWR